MLDASAFLPSSGLLSDENWFHFPGSFSGCRKINRDFQKKAQYCLITYTNDDNDPDDILDETKNFPAFIEHVLPNQEDILRMSASYKSRYVALEPDQTDEEDAPILHSAIYKVGKCLPYECTNEDVR